MTEPMYKRSHTVRDATVEDVAIWCIEQQLDPKEVILAGSVGLRWQSPQTKKEREMQEKWDRERVEREEEWERRTYARLKEKYGDV